MAPLALPHCFGLIALLALSVEVKKSPKFKTSLALLGSKVGHQVVSFALPHCLGMPYWHYQLGLSLYLQQSESHQLSLHKPLSVSQSVSQ